MKQVKRLAITLGLTISFFLVFPQPAYASIDAATFDGMAHAYYIDPGTGSIIVQVLIGMVVGGLAMIGIYRIRVKNFLLNLFKKRKGDEESE